MGILAEIGGRTFEVSDYQVTEESTPTVLSDTSGSVGSISLTIPKPDPYLWRGREYSKVMSSNLLTRPWPTPTTVTYDPSLYSVTLNSLGSVDPVSGRSEALRVEFSDSNPAPAEGVILNGDSPIHIPRWEDFWISIRFNDSSLASGWEIRLLTPDGVVRDQFNLPSGTELRTYTRRFQRSVAGEEFMWWDSPLNVELRSYVGVISGSRWADVVSVTVGVGDYGRSTRDFTGWTPDTSDRAYEFRGVPNDSVSDELSVRAAIPQNDELLRFGSTFLNGQTVRLIDSERGVTSGTIVSVDDQGSVVNLDCTGGLQPLVVDNVYAVPQLSTDAGGTVSVREVFASFVAMSGTTASYWVDPSIADVQVKFPGWQGELWTRMKEFCAVHKYEIAFVSEAIVLRPIRQRVVERHRLQISESRGTDSSSSARDVEVAYAQGMYGDFTERQVYPAPGWEAASALPVFTADIGVWNRIEIPISGSLVYWPGVRVEFDVLADNGLVIPTSRITYTAFVPEDDPSRVIFDVLPHQEIRSYVNVIDDNPSVPQSVSFAVQAANGTQSSLRVYGYGVTYGAGLVSSNTGAGARTISNTGASLDSPFVTSLNSARRVSASVAKAHAGLNFSWSGSVVRTQREIGTIETATYQFVADDIAANAPGGTYADAQAYVESFPGGGTYRDAREYWNSIIEPQFDTQLFGNVAGSRVYDRETNRWYRIRRATITPTTIDVTAENDLLTGEAIQPHIDAGETYADVQSEYDGYTYGQVMMMGDYHPPAPIALELGFLDEGGVWTPVSQSDPLPTERV